MRTERYGRVEVILPDLDEELAEVDDLGPHGHRADFTYSGHSLRQLDLSGRRLARGRVRGVEAQQANFADTTFESISFERCAWLSSRWQGCSLSRVQFRDCKIIGATIGDQKWANVVFQNCVLDYITFDAVRASGPVVFADCRLREATFASCHLSRGLMRGCELEAVEFAGGDFRDFDLRGNDLSTVRGAANLGGAIVTMEQRPQLAEALVSELALTYLEDSK